MGRENEIGLFTRFIDCAGETNDRRDLSQSLLEIPGGREREKRVNSMDQKEIHLSGQHPFRHLLDPLGSSDPSQGR
jgi:hypothetical protein